MNKLKIDDVVNAVSDFNSGNFQLTENFKKIKKHCNCRLYRMGKLPRRHWQKYINDIKYKQKRYNKSLELLSSCCVF
jgi:hypothetical protein